jgi:hypothetical protein
VPCAFAKHSIYIDDVKGWISPKFWFWTALNSIWSLSRRVVFPCFQVLFIQILSLVSTTILNVF